MSSSTFSSSSWRNVRPAWLLALLILVGFAFGLIGDLFCLQHYQGGCLVYATDLLAQNNSQIIFQHQYYQMFTSILVTSSPLDAGFNAVAVLVLDRITEDSLNKTRYFLVFFSTAFVGDLFSLLHGPNYGSAGASGGIFGIYACLVTFSFLKDKEIDLPALVLFLVIFSASSLLSNVDYLAHFGGALGGLIVGTILYSSVKKTITDYSSTSYKSSPSTSIVTFGVLLLISVASILQFFIFLGVIG